MKEYHSNFFTGGTSHRSDLEDRLKLIKSNLDKTDTLLDVGTSGGYFSFGLHDTFKKIVAIDSVPDLIERCKKTQEHHKTFIQFHTMDLKCILDTKETFDCILYMSVHHHIIEQYGHNEAEELFRELSSRAPLMFFDTGQKNENCNTKWWRMLPEVKSSQEEHLRNYIQRATCYDQIECIGSSRIHNIDRLLWKLSR